MNQDNNKSEDQTNRFIFSDNFYDQIPEVEDKKILNDKVKFPPKKKIEKKPNKVKEKQDPIIPALNDNDQIIKDFSLPVYEEPKKEIKPDYIEISNEENKQLEPTIHDSYQPEFTNVEINNYKPEKEETYSNNFNVETGINTELEKELMSQSQIEDYSVSELPVPNIEKEKPKRILYKVERKKRINNDPMQSFSPTSSNTETKVEETSEKSIREENRSIDDFNLKFDLVDETDTEDLPFTQPAIINIDEEEKKQGQDGIKKTIDSILDIPDFSEMLVSINKDANPHINLKVDSDKEEIEEKKIITYSSDKDDFEYDGNIDNVEIIKSDLLERLEEEAEKEGKISILAKYGDDFCSRDFITNPAIGRKEEIKQVILALLTPEKSAILVGKPGIGKTSIAEGLAYQIQRNNVPDAIKGYRIVSIKTTSLLGTLPTGETRLQTLVDELKDLDKIILFIDEIHMLIGSTNESAMDFANMFKESLGRGSIKMIGATTTEEYERYVLRDKAFVRRFQKIDVEEPTREQTIKILIGTLPKIEKTTGAKLKYTSYVQSEIAGFITDITSEYKRVYGIGSRYPDICITLLAQAFSQAVFDNRKEVTIFDIRNAISNSKNIYPDVIRKELVNFDIKFKDTINDENK